MIYIVTIDLEKKTQLELDLKIKIKKQNHFQSSQLKASVVDLLL